MSYFNHAFTKVFLGTGATLAPGVPSATDPATTDGFITTVNVPTSTLSAVGFPAGYFGVFDPKTYLTIQPDENVTTCCPFLIAGSPIMSNDKIGPYAGGYRETNKSKIINPKYVHQIYYVEPCDPQQSVISIGNTPGDGDAGSNPDNYQGATTNATCCFEFLCGETYYLRLDVKGEAALRFLNRNAYWTIDAYTGCCPTPDATAVNSTLVMLDWAQQIVDNELLNDLIFPVVFDEAGDPWYPDGTTVTLDGTATPVSPAEWFSAYDRTTAHVPDACAGMRLYGAYVETKFGNCTFQVTDFFEKEPLLLYASMVDYTGDPCTFEGLCVYTECRGVQGMGFGEQVLRDVILSESYLQNYVGSGTDMRVREITQGYDIIDAVDRNALLGRYFIKHTVPRYNNPSGVFDNDQYMLEIIVTQQIAEFEAVMGFVLDGCPNCVSLDVQTCTPCEYPPDTTV